MDGPTVQRDTIAFSATKDEVISSADDDSHTTDHPTSDQDHVSEVDAFDDEDLGAAPSSVQEGYGTPPVVAVLVAHDPGVWFEETLDSLAEVDYDNLTVLVIDNGGSEGLNDRIAEILPTAFVKRVDSDSGFSAAANTALESIEGAAFYLFCHDDVRLAPNALTELVAEAFRSNAGVVGPKLVDWDDPQILRSVGIRVDPFGFSSQISEPGELDQSQHDTPRPVFAVSSAAMLIRADLFATLGGFDERIPFFGEDVDICWRSQSAGASVAYCPAAVVAHRERFEDRRHIDNRQRLEIRHDTRTMLKNYSLGRLLRVLPVAAVLSLIDLLGSMLLGRFQRAGDIASAWAWNAFHIGSLSKSRGVVKRTRTVPDSSYVGLMRQGSSRLRTLIRGAEGESRLQALAASGRGYLVDATSRSKRVGVALTVLALVVMLYGGRDLILGQIPAMREIPLIGSSPWSLIREWLSGWRESGFGEPAVAPGIVPLAGVSGWVLLGSLSAVRRLFILGPLVVGALGAWKLFNRSGSIAARGAALVVYTLNPIVLNAISEGRFQALCVYAAAPWFIRRLARGAGLEPFAGVGLALGAGASDRGPTDPDDGVRHQAGVGTDDFWRVFAGSALILGLVLAASPLGAMILVDTALIFGLVAIVLIDRRAGLHMVGLALLSGLGAGVVASPWLYSVLRDGDLGSLTGLFRTGVASPSAAQIMTGSIGALRTGLLGWGMLLAALFGLVAARGWRFGWALSSWLVALSSWGVAIVLAKSDLFGGAGLELILMPTVIAMTIAVGIGALSFETDVLGSEFGATQIFAGVAAVGLLVGVVPIAVASLDGRWYQPGGDFDSVLEPVDDARNFRTVWIGDADVLPVASWSLDESSLAIGTSIGLEPGLSSRYRADGGTGVGTLAKAVRAAMDGQTSRLGRLLGPLGVKYVIIVDRSNPVPYARAQAPMHRSAVTAMLSQVDLTSIDVNPAMVMFRVDGNWPQRSDITDSVDREGDVDTLSAQIWTDPGLPAPVLRRGSGTRFRGELKAGMTVFQSVTADPGWTLTKGTEGARKSDWRGWGQRFDVPSSGEWTLRFKTPWTFRLLQMLQVVSLVALVFLVLSRGRRHLRLAKVSRSTTPAERILTVSATTGRSGTGATGGDPVPDGGPAVSSESATESQEAHDG